MRYIRNVSSLSLSPKAIFNLCFKDYNKIFDWAHGNVIWTVLFWQTQIQTKRQKSYRKYFTSIVFSRTFLQRRCPNRFSLLSVRKCKEHSIFLPSISSWKWIDIERNEKCELLILLSQIPRWQSLCSSEKLIQKSLKISNQLYEKLTIITVSKKNTLNAFLFWLLVNSSNWTPLISTFRPFFRSLQ